MADTCVRRIRILQMLKSKADGYITIPEIMVGLTHYGIDDVKKRTVERDMQDLSLDFSIICDSSKRPYRWWWDGNENIEIPAMGRNTALTFKLAQEYLEPLMPATSFKFLKPKFNQASRILTTKDKLKEKEWINKIRVMAHEVQSFPVQEPYDVHIAVYDALYDNKMLNILYSPPNKEESTRSIHPLALIYRGTNTELIAVDEKDNIIKRFILNRIKKADIQIRSSMIPNDFNLDEFISKQFAFPASGEKIQLKAWVSWDGKTKLIENPLSKNQKVEETDDNGIIITASVIDSNELTTWILGLGPRIKILEPEFLKDKIAGMVQQTASLYRNN